MQTMKKYKSNLLQIRTCFTKVELGNTCFFFLLRRLSSTCQTPMHWRLTCSRVPCSEKVPCSEYSPCSCMGFPAHTGSSSVATIFGPPANNLFGPLAKGLRRLLLPGGPLAGPFSPAGPPAVRGACGALATPLTGSLLMGFPAHTGSPLMRFPAHTGSLFTGFPAQTGSLFMGFPAHEVPRFWKTL